MGNRSLDATAYGDRRSDRRRYLTMPGKQSVVGNLAQKILKSLRARRATDEGGVGETGGTSTRDRDDVYVSSPAPVLMTTMGGTVAKPLQSTCFVSASSETRDSSLSVHRESLQLSSPLHSFTRLLYSYLTNEIQLSESCKRPLPPSTPPNGIELVF